MSDRYVAYFDESGTHAGSPALAIAGFVASPMSWEAFSVEWFASLADFGLPYFHMTDFANRAGPYSAWSEKTRRERLTRLLGIVDRHASFSVATAFELAAYDRVLSGVGRQRSGGPYGMAATGTAMTLGRHARQAGKWLDYVFESGAPGRGQVLKVFEDNRRDDHDYSRIDSIAFLDKREHSPLQAADILAYEIHRELPRQMAKSRAPGSPEALRAPRHPLRVLAAMPHDWGFLDEATLSKAAYVVTLGLEWSQGTWHMAPGASTIRPKQDRRRRKR